MYAATEVSQEDDVKGAVATAFDTFGKLTILVNNAAPTDLVTFSDGNGQPGGQDQGIAFAPLLGPDRDSGQIEDFEESGQLELVADREGDARRDADRGGIRSEDAEGEAEQGRN